MSRSTIRVFLTVLISIGVLAAVFMSVQAVSAANAQNDSLGMYVLSGGLVNPLEAKAESQAPQAMPHAYPKGEGGGHGGCESKYIDPNDL